VSNLDPATLAAAEKVVRDRIPRTKFAGEARLLRSAADAIHQLGDADEPVGLATDAP
jgi:hypothetical protein